MIHRCFFLARSSSSLKHSGISMNIKLYFFLVVFLFISFTMFFNRNDMKRWDMINTTWIIIFRIETRAQLVVLLLLLFFFVIAWYLSSLMRDYSVYYDCIKVENIFSYWSLSFFLHQKLKVVCLCLFFAAVNFVIRLLIYYAVNGHFFAGLFHDDNLTSFIICVFTVRVEILWYEAERVSCSYKIYDWKRFWRKLDKQFFLCK